MKKAVKWVKNFMENLRNTFRILIIKRNIKTNNCSRLLEWREAFGYRKMRIIKMSNNNKLIKDNKSL